MRYGCLGRIGKSLIGRDLDVLLESSKATLINRVVSLKPSLCRLRKKVFGRISEKSLR